MTNKTKAKRNFTLIELLVVIAIIAILAGILMPAIRSVRERGRATSAQADVQALRVAISQYEGTFSYWPMAPDIQVNTDTRDFLSVLTGDGNTRKIQFLETRGDGSFVDPWENPYQVIGTYDNKVTVEGNEINTSLAVWSYGPDGPGADRGGWITSWRN